MAEKTILEEVRAALGGTHTQREAEARKAGRRFLSDNPIANRAAILQAQKAKTETDALVERVTANVMAALTKSRSALARKMLEVKK